MSVDQEPDRLDLKILPLTLCLYMVMLGIVVNWFANLIFPMSMGRYWGIAGLLLLLIAFRGVEMVYSDLLGVQHQYQHDETGAGDRRTGPLQVFAQPDVFLLCHWLHGIGVVDGFAGDVFGVGVLHLSNDIDHHQA